MELTVKVVVLTDNTSIISRISELRSETGEAFCFLLSYPFLLENNVNEEGVTNVRFAPYNPYIQDNEIRVPFGSVKHVCEAKQFIRDKYIEVVTPFDPAWAQRELNKTEEETEETEEVFEE